MFIRKYWVPISVFLVAIAGISFYGYSESETLLAKAEKLILSEKYYEAILALEPLLMSEEKSEAQEQALWLAHQLGEKVAEKISKEYVAMLDMPEPEDFGRKYRDRSAFRAATKSVKHFNQLGADIYYFEPGRAFFYDVGFLQRLIDHYPETLKRAVAEYLLIFNRSGFPRQENLSLTLSALHAYIENYKETGRIEVYKAYLEIAHIHHGLWAVMTFEGCDSGMATLLAPGDNAKSAEAHKAEAEKYYMKYHFNPHRLPEDQSYERLKNREKFGWNYIIYGGC